MKKAPALADFRRIVVKVGSSLLIDAAAGRVKEDWLASLAEDIAVLHRDKRDLLVVSSGAIALGRSVLRLPAGVIRVDGQFARGDAVIIRGPGGDEIGRGLVAYDAEDADKIKGRSSADISTILGFGGRTEMVHRDHLAVGAN
jgi:glutamate 5-kinase